MHEVLRTLSEIGIIPVVALEDAADAAPLAKALCAGGIPTAEVTFRTGAAAASIAAIRQNVPEMLVGAGTVLTVENAEAAVAAGAAYIVTPGIQRSGGALVPRAQCARSARRQHGLRSAEGSGIRH